MSDKNDELKLMMDMLAEIPYPDMTDADRVRFRYLFSVFRGEKDKVEGTQRDRKPPGNAFVPTKEQMERFKLYLLTAPSGLNTKRRMQ